MSPNWFAQYQSNRANAPNRTRNAAQRAAEDDVMTWTDERPTEPGEYWLSIQPEKRAGRRDFPKVNLCFKVCDQGRYYLGTLESPKLFQYGDEEKGAEESTYVPDDFLCHGDDGYGDYIIMDVSGDGQIAKYERPTPERAEWVRLS